ncbi:MULTISPECIES: alpha/beta hydrolase [Mycobacteriaceae]|uniref:Alpha/beta hydrolase n=1 Tax=Mycolicibacterium mucogenicum DSM 44124 TaxID=1226753 RepID=A0A8H2PH66_MYCMU|nr:MULTISPECIES: alpha/beta hydrolase [Mycobacteriaceae]KAB7758053.1 alpha/beta hydrolase [Mycolicibacterium mucogenicum DSM 44124]QPG71479.1 alpha/beta hydrolase [Mycolicibacterium mucogenicum DSM 44124]
MSIERRLDPALRHLVGARIDLAAETLVQLRESLDSRRRLAAAAVDVTGVDVADAQVAAAGRVIPVRIYRAGGRAVPAVLFCHSGGFVLGNLDTDHRWCLELARAVGCAVVSVDYRLAPEHPYPAAFDDVAAVLEWIADHAAALDVDAQRIAVAGNSAGGGLAALVAQASAVGALPPVVFQLLHQPVLDDRPTPSKADFSTTPGFDGPAVELMWQHYLAGAPVPAGAVPGRTAELAGVPTALITCAELDPLRDEAVDYALRLMWAGVTTELHVYPGTCHGFESFLPDWQTSRDLLALHAGALRRALCR